MWRGAFIKNFRIRAFTVTLMMIVVLIIFGARFWSLYEDAHNKYLEISMKSSVNGVAQIFYDIGQGFSEEQSSKMTVYMNDEFREYRFSLPENKIILNLRFDPLASSGHVEIRQISITDGLGNSFLRFHPKQLVAANHISRLDIISDRVSVDIDTNADDPQIYIGLEKPFLQNVHPSYHANLFLSFCFIWLLVFSIYLWIVWNDKKGIKTLIYNGLKRREKLLSGISLCLLIFLIWSWVYNRTSWIAWQTPLSYGGDTSFMLAYAKAFMDGDVTLFMPKMVAHLSAPFSANWNDFPITEKIIFAIMGWLGREVGLFPAANFMVLLAHMLAGLSFLYVCRELNYRTSFAFSGALLFAFSHYSFFRNLAHIIYTYYWHVPLMLLVTWWIYSSRPILIKSRKWFVAITIAAISGIFSHYYTWMFLQFLGFGVLLHFARKQFNLMKFSLLLIGVTLLSYLIVNIDTLSYALLHGLNLQAARRTLAGLEIHALKIPELVFPPIYHSWDSWANYGQNHYFLKALIKGEVGSPYLGLVGLLGLVWLAGDSFYRFLQGKLHLVPVYTWQTLWILLYSLGGGINLLLGTLGLQIFRGTNRYSIFILAIILLFLVRQLSRIRLKNWGALIAVVIAVMGLWDQLPPRVSEAQILQGADIVKSDRNFSKELEEKLPRNSMIFQLPVVAFPEIPNTHQMDAYEHFRPYLFTHTLHYSFGSNKGRGDNDWQLALHKLPSADMVSKLETYGFGGIIINRKGYEDKGESLINELANIKRHVLSDNGDLVAIRLNPASEPTLPESPVFSVGWSTDEGTHRWAVSNYTEINLMNSSNRHKPVTIGFTLMTLKPRDVLIGLNGKLLQNLSLGRGGVEPHFKMNSVILAPGQNVLFIKTDIPPVLAGHGDTRKLSFGISNFQMGDLVFLSK